MFAFTCALKKRDGLVDFHTAEVLRLYEAGSTVTLNRAQQVYEPLASACEVSLSRTMADASRAAAAITVDGKEYR